MTLKIKALIALLIAGLFFASGFGTMYYIHSKAKLGWELDQTNRDLAATQELANKLDKRNQENLYLQSKIDELNTEATRNLNAKLAENDRLRSDLTGVQLRLKNFSCPRSTAQNNSSTGTVGEGEVELTGTLRQDIFNLRASIIRDGEKLDYWRKWSEAVIAQNPQIEKPRP